MDNLAVGEMAVVPTNGTGAGALLRRVQCPPAMFGEGHYIVLRPMKIKMQRRIRQMDLDNDEDVTGFQDVIAEHIQSWNLVDPWTGEDLQISGEDLDELSAEQWTWLVQELSDPNRRSSAQTT